MPKPKHNRARANFMLRGHKLTDTAATTLASLLGYENADFGKIIGAVEVTLGISLDGAEHLDNPPRPAHYVAEFKAARNGARNLFEMLEGWTEFYRDQLAINGGDIEVIEDALISLAFVSQKVINKFEGCSSKGARKNTALTETVRQLRQIFRRHYKGPQTGRTRRGAFQHLGEEEARELKFVETALRDARIIKKGYRDLPKLFRDPRCAVPPASAEENKGIT